MTRQWWLILGGLLGGAWAGGCGGDDGGGPAPPDALVEVLPPAAAACTAPTVVAGSRIVAAELGSVASVALAWSGSEAAVVYQTPDERPFLQRLDRDGLALGAPIALPDDGHATTDEAVVVTSDGAGFQACWEANNGLNEFTGCAAVPVGGDAGVAGLRGGGRVPVIASDHQHRLLVTAVGASYGLSLLDAQAAFVSSPGGGLYLGRGGVTPRPQGGFVVGTSESVGAGGRHPYWLELASDGTPRGDMLQNQTGGDFVGLAATAQTAVMLLADNVTDEPFALALTPDATAVALDAPGVMLRGGAIARGAGSFAAVWSWSPGSGTQFRYRALSPDGAVAGEPVDLAVAGTEGQLALTATDTGFLLATIDRGDVVVSRLSCP